MTQGSAPMDDGPLAEAAVRRRYKRALSESETEHARVVEELGEYYDAYSLDSIRGKDFAHLQKVWGDHPPEIGMVLSAVHDFWGQLTSSRRMPSFPGFDTGIADEIVGKAMSMLLDAGRRWAHSDDVDEQALLDLLLVGLAFGEDSLETRGRPPFRPLERYVPIPDIRWDVNANLKGLSDARYWIPRHYYSLDEALARHPEHEERIKAAAERLGGYGSHPGPQEGAQSLGGRNTTVRLYGSDGSPIASEGSRWQREIQVDDFQFLVHESLVMWDGKEVPAAEFSEAMELLEEEAIRAGVPFEKPEVQRYAQGTWYRCEMLVETMGGDPLMLSEPRPIPGNQPLAKAMTGFPKRMNFEQSGRMRTQWFCFGRTLTGLQKLSSVTVRIGIEQEARRNRMGGLYKDGAFSTPSQKENFINAQITPGAFAEVANPEMIQFNEPSSLSHVGVMKDWFSFLSVDLPGYIHARSDMSRGTFQGDRSQKFVATMIETGNQMNQMLTSAFTAWLSKGAVTMARLVVDGLDPKDIDRLLGRQPLWEGITGQINPESGQVEPIPLLDEAGQPQLDEATGQPLIMTLGRFLKENVGEIFDNDISFGLRPSAASQRLADQELISQHGVFKDLISVAPPEIMVPAYLKLYAEGTPMYEAAAQLEAHYKKVAAQQEEQAQAASEEGMLQFIQDLAGKDLQRALQLVQAASQAVIGSQAEDAEIPQIQ